MTKRIPPHFLHGLHHPSSRDDVEPFNHWPEPVALHPGAKPIVGVDPGRDDSTVFVCLRSDQLADLQGFKITKPLSAATQRRIAEGIKRFEVVGTVLFESPPCPMRPMKSVEPTSVEFSEPKK